MSTLTRSTGVLLSIFIAFFIGNAILIRTDRCCATFRSITIAIICICIMFMPLIIIVYWRPYYLHCGVRYERDWQGPYPEWCYDDFPNVYTYIQLKYWDNRFLGFLYRPLNNLITSIAMNIIYLAMTLRMMTS